MTFVALEEFCPRISVALPAEMLECVGRRHAADLGTHAVAGAASHALEKSSAEGIADARRVDNSVRWDGEHIGGLMPLDDGAAILAARNHERAAARENRRFVEAGFLADQFELVVVADDYSRGRHPIPELVA